MKNGQFPEIIRLGDLNGQNGFKLDVESGFGFSSSVSAVEDVNGDGYGDLMIGANADYSQGNIYCNCIYVVFGGSDIGASGGVNLSQVLMEVMGLNSMVKIPVFAVIPP